MSLNQLTIPEDLGHAIGEFGWNKGRAKFLVGAWIFIFLISLPIALFLIGLPGLIASIYFIQRSLKRLRSKEPVILVYQHGLVDRRQKTADIIRYEEIKNLLLSVVVINGVLNYVVTLETQTGRKIKIDEHVANVDHLRTLLEEQLLQLQLPATIAAYLQGTPIVFGNLTLTQAGLSAGKRTLLWSEFDSADVQRQYKSVEFIIRQKGSQKNWFTAPRDTFPNLALFFALVNSIRAAQG